MLLLPEMWFEAPELNIEGPFEEVFVKHAKELPGGATEGRKEEEDYCFDAWYLKYSS